jgi:hypothetical protein
MAVQLIRPRNVRVAAGSTLSRRPRRKRSGPRLAFLALQALIVGALVGLSLATHQTPGTVLFLGAAILAWAMLSFGLEKPRQP